MHPALAMCGVRNNCRTMHLAGDNAQAGDTYKQIKLCWVENTAIRWQIQRNLICFFIILVLAVDKKQGHLTLDMHK